MVGDLNGRELLDWVGGDDFADAGVETAVVKGDGMLANENDGLAEDLTVDQQHSGRTLVGYLRQLLLLAGLSLDEEIEVVEEGLETLEGEAIEVDDLAKLCRKGEEWEDAHDVLELSPSDTPVARVVKEGHGRGALLSNISISLNNTNCFKGHHIPLRISCRWPRWSWREDSACEWLVATQYACCCYGRGFWLTTDCCEELEEGRGQRSSYR